jgi:translation initiation factor 1
MSRQEKKKKLSSGEGFSVGGGSGLGMSIGSLLKGGHEPAEIPAAQDMQQPKTAQPVAGTLAGLAKAALQRRSAGCGGKIVTIVVLPQGAKVDPEALAKEMRKALGCGSRVEDGRIVLQGDIADRAKEWLLRKGVKNVVG